VIREATSIQKMVLRCAVAEEELDRLEISVVVETSVLMLLNFYVPVRSDATPNI